MKRKGLVFVFVIVLVCLFSIPALAVSANSVQVMPIYRAVDTYDWTHSYYTNLTSYQNYLNSDPSDNIADGTAGYISPQPLPGLVPLYNMGYVMDRYLAAGDDIRDALIINYGFWNGGVIGYVAPANSGLGDKNMHLWFRGGSGNHAYNDQDHYFHDAALYVSDYTYEGTPFRTWDEGSILQSIELTAPASGATLVAGDTVQIKWTSILSEGNVNLYYSKTGVSGPWITIKTGLSPEDSSYSWTVPNAAGTNVALLATWSYTGDYGTAYIEDKSATYTIKSTTLSPTLPNLNITPIFKIAIPSAPSNLLASGDLLGKKVTLTWQDNADCESGYVIERKTSGGSYSQIAATAANVVTYADTTAVINTQYTYRVKAKGTLSDSAYSNEATGGYSLNLFVTPKLELAFPDTPQNLAATLASAASIELEWSAVSGSISGYKIERMIEPSGVWEVVGSVSSSKTSYTDNGLAAATTYDYRVRSYDDFFVSASSNEVSMTTMAEGTGTGDSGGESGSTGGNTLVFSLGVLAYNVNGAPQSMDVAPQAINGRTFLPIRFVTTPMGADMVWDPIAKKVTITKGTTVIELWINNPVAKVNGIDTPIDESNSTVMPAAINGRTMLPLRFIAEQLGCTVDWNPQSKTITVTY